MVVVVVVIIKVRVTRAQGASGGAAAHPPQLPGEGSAPAARLAHGPQQTHQLRRLPPVRRSLALAARAPLLTHGRQHLANVGRQQVVHLVALWWRNSENRFFTL